MALQQPIDATLQFNQNGYFVIDCGGFDYIEAQVVNPSENVKFYTTNDSGDIQGVSDGNYKSATNFISVLGTNVATGTTIDMTNATSLIKFNNIGRFLRLESSDTLEKLILRLYKIS